MQNRPALAAVEDYSLPRALIIGSDGSAERLAQVLRQSGCFVEIREQNFGGQGKYDYIFQYGNLFLATEVLKRHLKPEGRFLFIETDKDESPLFENLPKIRIIRVGATYIWDVNSLCDAILSVMFAGDAERIVDHRKRASSPLSPPREVSTTPLPTANDTQQVVFEAPFVEHKRRHGRILYFGFLGVVICVISAGLFVWWYVTSIQTIISHTRSHIASSDWKNLRGDLTEAEEKLIIADGIYQGIYTVLIPFRDSQQMKDIDDVLRISHRLIDTGGTSLSFFQHFSLSRSGAFSGVNGVSQEDFDQASQRLDEMVGTLADAKKRMTTMTLPYFPKDQVGVFINTSLDKLLSVRQVLPIAKKLFLTDHPKVYLVLLQNTMELRPTGGFIGSFGILTVNNGKIVDLQIQDVYTADGQLKGHVDPPEPIRRYMDQPNWFLRDSNFDPDFSLSAQQASWFLQKEMGITVDGVIGVNLFVAQNLLRVVGPLTLSDFNNEVIHADNFFFQAQRYTQKDFFPGSTQKRDFLTAVSKTLLSKITSGEKISWFDLFTVLKDGLDQKHILLFTQDTELQKSIETVGWGGRMVDVRCVDRGQGSVNAQDTCYADYLSINEANIGVNKANYFVTKSTAIEKKLSSDGKLTTMITITYKNGGVSEILQGGTYTNYLRVYVPAGSQLVGASLNTVPLAATDIDIVNYQGDKQSFGTLVKIAPNNTAVVRIGYTSPRPMPQSTRSYQLFYQKQGGDKSSPLIVSMVTVPQYPLSPLNFNLQHEDKNDLSYITDTSVDRVFAFDIGKK